MLVAIGANWRDLKNWFIDYQMLIELMKSCMDHETNKAKKSGITQHLVPSANPRSLNKCLYINGLRPCSTMFNLVFLLR